MLGAGRTTPPTLCHIYSSSYSHSTPCHCVLLYSDTALLSLFRHCPPLSTPWLSYYHNLFSLTIILSLLSHSPPFFALSLSCSLLRHWPPFFTLSDLSLSSSLYIMTVILSVSLLSHYHTISSLSQDRESLCSVIVLLSTLSLSSFLYSLWSVTVLLSLLPLICHCPPLTTSWLSYYHFLFSHTIILSLLSHCPLPYALSLSCSLLCHCPPFFTPSDLSLSSSLFIVAARLSLICHCHTLSTLSLSCSLNSVFVLLSLYSIPFLYSNSPLRVFSLFAVLLFSFCQPPCHFRKFNA